MVVCSYHPKLLQQVTGQVTYIEQEEQLGKDRFCFSVSIYFKDFEDLTCLCT